MSIFHTSDADVLAQARQLDADALIDRNWNLETGSIANDAPPWAQIVFSAMKQVATIRDARRMKPFLPYAIHEQNCVINRRYRAVGFSSAWTDYECLYGWHVIPAEVAALRANGVVNDGGYFFTDANPPWAQRQHLLEYRRKLCIFLFPYRAKP
jgi:hypothetical protein